VRTDADLYDLLQRLFGLGEWDEHLSSEPWWQHRLQQIAKIKRSRTSRNVDLVDLERAAYYAKRTGEDVRAVTWLYKLISPAIRDDNERRRAARTAQLDFEIARAIEREHESDPDSPWVDRLVRARGTSRREVYEAWLHRSSSCSPARGDGHPTASSA
jgi:hypothetical protein